MNTDGMSTYSLEHKEAGPILTLSEEATIESAADLHRALTAAVGGEGTFAVDAGKIRRIDASVLQLLVAVSRISPVHIIAASSQWKDAVERYGLTADFSSHEIS